MEGRSLDILDPLPPRSLGLRINLTSHSKKITTNFLKKKNWLWQLLLSILARLNSILLTNLSLLPKLAWCRDGTAN